MRKPGAPVPATAPPVASRRRPTRTSSFGVSRRESHDASAFYARFAKPELSGDDELSPPQSKDHLWLGDARDMDRYGDIGDSSVALVVTSPPYFAGKDYEEALGQGHIPANYADYLGMLHAVFDECKRKLESGGRVAVNVANLGRKPYRSLSSDVMQILEELGFLLRGEIIWKKQAAAGGSCAWGTYQRPGNPVLRDITERVIVASKGRFDRALSAQRRLSGGWPNEGSMFMDDFVDATTDLWDIPAESATRVGHPAPFPVELPRRLIELYTYRGDLVLDPFLGSGSTAIAALRTQRSYVGFDTDQTYLDLAERRIADERHRTSMAADSGRPRVVVSALRPRSDRHDDRADLQAGALRQGCKAKELAALALQAAGFADIENDVAYRDLGLEVSFRARDRLGGLWLFDMSGAFSSTRPGLKRTDTLWRALGKASVLHEADRRAGGRRPDVGPLVLLSTDVPPPNSAGERALRTVVGDDHCGPVHDIIEVLNDRALERLAGYAQGGRRKA